MVRVRFQLFALWSSLARIVAIAYRQAVIGLSGTGHMLHLGEIGVN